MKSQALQEISRKPLCFGDFIRKEFDDVFLKENVCYISVSDIEDLIENKQVKTQIQLSCDVILIKDFISGWNFSS